MFEKRKSNKTINLIKNKKLPILTLDSRWHELFARQNKPYIVKQLERQVTKLMQRQGKLVNEIKDLKKIKKDLMKEIVEHIPDGENAQVNTDDKTMDRNKKLIEDINKRIDNQSELLAELPYQIRTANEKLMLESIQVCYKSMQTNKVEINKIKLWIEDIRNKLKDNIIRKQELEEQSYLIYSYMHDVLGPDVIEIFDENVGDIIKKDKD
ncbi:MAG TPA: hypothetical protein GXZ90_07970 [Clostridiales bacterium]|nr:hypothetical protein [Clostridiales bacterium]